MRIALVLLLAAVGLSCGGPAGGPCGPLNCFGCCNAQGFCESGKTDDKVCGKDGQSCGACTGSTTCQAGVCASTGGGTGGGVGAGGGSASVGGGSGSVGGGVGGGGAGGSGGTGGTGGSTGGGSGGTGGSTGGGSGGGSAMGGGAGGSGGTGGTGGGTTDGGLTAEQIAILAARPYTTVVPSGYDAGTPVPLVVLLHGYGADGAIQNTYFGFSALANSKTFILATPNGMVDGTGKRFWNATNACCDGFGTGVDDVKYLTAILDEAALKYRIDPKRVFFVGHSNGGFMSHRMACDRANRIAAIVSLAGATFANPALCTPSAPVSVLQVHGTVDATIAYDGGSTLGGAATAYPSAPQTVATWAAKNGCNATLATLGAAFDLDTAVVGAETNPAAHSCTTGAAELWTMTGSGHIPGLDAKWGTALWTWLEAHPKP